jgi:hypothetical protein
MWMFGEMNVEAEVCRRQHKTIAGGRGGEEDSTKTELYFIKSGAVYSMVSHHGRKCVYTACCSGPSDFAFQLEV